MPTNFNEEKQEKQIESLHLKEAEKLAQILSARYKIPYVDLTQRSIDVDALSLVSEERSREGGFAIFQAVGKDLQVAILTPNNNILKSELEGLQSKNFNPTLHLTSKNSLEKAWQRYADISKSDETDIGLIDISDKKVAEHLAKFKSIDDVKDEVTKEAGSDKKQGGISNILEIILSGAIAIDASDIHFEAQEESMRLRYRLDGILEDVGFLSTKIYRQILSRIKLVSGLKLNIHEVAQDGRFSIHLNEQEIEIRTSIVPGAYGESIVLRVLNPENIRLDFKDLGIEDHLFSIVNEEIHKPTGLILLTGPTGSGKTTTLYAFLGEVNSQESKILTIEDPIEYHLTGINQTQVDQKKNYTFASGLRAAMRQDPDIIMVGEIRDAETADVAINASLTGHVVFSTLHTNTAAGAIPRLIDLGVNPKLIGSSLTLSIAQRLVRRLCKECRTERPYRDDEKAFLEKVTAKIKAKRPELNTTLPANTYDAVGCGACNNTGYKGRIAIYEAVMVDEKVGELAVTNPSDHEISKIASSQGILSLLEDGIIKVITGTTTIKELGRVIDLKTE